MSRHTGAFVYTGSGKKHAEDAPMLDGLIEGYAPGQKHSAHPVKHHSAGDRPRSRVKPALPKAAHGGH